MALQHGFTTLLLFQARVPSSHTLWRYIADNPVTTTSSIQVWYNMALQHCCYFRQEYPLRAHCGDTLLTILSLPHQAFRFGLHTNHVDHTNTNIMPVVCIIKMHVYTAYEMETESTWLTCNFRLRTKRSQKWQN